MLVAARSSLLESLPVRCGGPARAICAGTNVMRAPARGEQRTWLPRSLFPSLSQIPRPGDWMQSPAGGTAVELTKALQALMIEALRSSQRAAIVLPPRSTVGHLPLEQGIGVRIPGGQPAAITRGRILAPSRDSNPDT